MRLFFLAYERLIAMVVSRSMRNPENRHLAVLILLRPDRGLHKVRPKV
jgi:hypothetical protein